MAYKDKRKKYEYDKQYRLAHKERRNMLQKIYAKRHLEKMNQLTGDALLAHKEKTNNRYKRYRNNDKNVEKVKASQARTKSKYRAKYLKKSKETQYLKRYNKTYQEISDMYDSQQGKCACCQLPLTKLDALPITRRNRTCVDHCHKTGKIRGLVHSICNTILGLAKDDPAILRLLTAYLEYHQQ